MIIKSLKQFNDEYESILHSDLTEDEKTVKYSSLMSEMERVYNIPLIKSSKWEQENKAVVAMYRKLSLSRNI